MLLPQAGNNNCAMDETANDMCLLSGIVSLQINSQWRKRLEDMPKSWGDNFRFLRDCHGPSGFLSQSVVGSFQTAMR